MLVAVVKIIIKVTDQVLALVSTKISPIPTGIKWQSHKMRAMELAGLNYFYRSYHVDLQWEDICPHHFPQNSI